MPWTRIDGPPTAPERMRWEPLDTLGPASRAAALAGFWSRPTEHRTLRAPPARPSCAASFRKGAGGQTRQADCLVGAKSEYPFRPTYLPRCRGTSRRSCSPRVSGGDRRGPPAVPELGKGVLRLGKIEIPPGFSIQRHRIH
jgi:hypothetical protein